MSNGTPAALLHLKPRPFRLSNEIPAGHVNDKQADRYRSQCVVPMGRLETYQFPPTLNQFGSKLYSSVPGHILGYPYDNSKPRKGRWGETLGTKMSEDSFLLEEEWDRMKVSRRAREAKAMEDAKQDLQKRIEICLYGAPRQRPVNIICPGPPYHLVTKQQAGLRTAGKKQ